MGWAPRGWVDSQTRTGAFLQRPDLREGYVEGRGGREGPIPPHQQSLGRTELQEKQGPWPGSGGGAQPLLGSATPPASVLAHSKVSHCFLSCSTEPGAGAGAGLTSCLVFHSKSSKGSLAS